MNQVFLHGRLGRDPELRHTKSGKAVVTLNVATDEYAGGEKKTEWHRVVAWENTAENVAKYLSKGSGVVVNGRLQTKEWQDKDGSKRYTTEIVAMRVEFTSKPQSGSNQEYPQSQPRQAPAQQDDHGYGPPPMDEEDVPF